MQDRYAGDAGDFGKLALLKALAGQMRVGVNWYLVDIPGEKTNNGKHVGYLDKPCSALCRCDLLLARQLRDLVKSERSVLQLQNILPHITFYNARLEQKNRTRWHAHALEILRGCDLIFLDPDNGLLVPSVKNSAPMSIKYVFKDEIAHYYKEGCSVFFYNHRSREPRAKYLGRFAELLKNPLFEDAHKLALAYSAYSTRDYIFIAQPLHSPTIIRVIDSFLGAGWNRYFKPLLLV